MTQYDLVWSQDLVLSQALINWKNKLINVYGIYQYLICKYSGTSITRISRGQKKIIRAIDNILYFIIQHKNFIL